MAFQLDRDDSLQELRSPTLSVGETAYDLSNLCLSAKPASLKERRRERSSSSRRLQAHDEWYPSQQELEDFSTDEICVEKLFGQPELRDRKQSPRRCRSVSPSILRSPGAFHSSYPQLNEKPALPAWVETAQELSEKAQRQGLLSAQAKLLEARRTDSTPAQYIEIPSVQSSSGLGSFEEASLDAQSSPAYHMDRCSDEERVNENPSQKIQIEVAPGLFMPLRGSDETMDAIESGRARMVICFACNAKLSCVPDCELVICPDCRVVSPVEDDEDDLHRSMPNLGSGDDNRYDDQSPGHTCSASLPPPRRGVGLGLKVRC